MHTPTQQGRHQAWCQSRRVRDSHWQQEGARGIGADDCRSRIGHGRPRDSQDWLHVAEAIGSEDCWLATRKIASLNRQRHSPAACKILHGPSPRHATAGPQQGDWRRHRPAASVQAQIACDGHQVARVPGNSPPAMYSLPCIKTASVSMDSY